MTFKESLEADLDTFINADEMADEHDLEGTVLNAVVQGLNTRDVITVQAKHAVDMDGMAGRTVIVHFKTTDYPYELTRENAIHLDGEVYRVADIIDDRGITTLTLEVDTF